MGNYLLEIRDIYTYYDKIAALKGVSLNLQKGEIVAIIGANGAGKTTLINTISGLIHPAQGRILFENNVISGMPAYKIARKGIVQIPEGRKLFPKLTVLENMELGAFSQNNKKEINENIEKMYALFPILKQRSKQYAGTMSGGEQQMLALARGLMAKPKVLLIDEPSMGLAPVLVEKTFQIIKEINAQGIAILLVEQNAKKSLEIASRAYVIETGKIIMTDNAHKLLENDIIKKAYLGEML
ncbi:MAG: ABC transporter ATP-binding protein [Elusimicrobia bacterium RIFOXYA2_FULL_39_19]|nr:MAG: ABC transporter ATP-binding protein [Elusimicrobia bacterium RIFOXYA2_FULL_39_19]